MELAGFYRSGRPALGVIDAASLRTSNQVDKRIRYSTVIDPSRLNATAIFELSGSPCIYFTRLDQADPPATELARLHELAWNQGLAPMLWVVTPAKVLLYNCYSGPSSEDRANTQRHVIGIFEQTESDLRRLNDFAGRLQIESGTFWRHERAQRIDRRQRVDALLLEDLIDAEAELVDAGLEPTMAHALLGRSIFVAYLQDRHILSPQFFLDHFKVDRFAEVLTDKQATYELFDRVQGIFNGSLFPLSRDREHADHEHNKVKPKHLEIVHHLLSGTKIKNRQMRLWPYKFDVIPVELISSIYEGFAYGSDPRAAQERSAHYTPINLVDLVLSQVFDGLAVDARVLDLSCGSGVFLVESLRRLVARRIALGKPWSREMVRDTLYRQVFGVDISSEAMQITAFSLYLAALELDPDPQPLGDLRFRPLIGHNLYCNNAFDEDAAFNVRAPFATREFGAIVGNPPWTRNKANTAPRAYCKRHGYHLAYGNNPDQAFLWRAGDFANENTVIGLILHGRPFFSHKPEAVEAKRALLTRFKLRVLMNLSALRADGLFPNAVAPAMVLVAEGRPCEESDSFSFVSVDRSEAFKRHGIIEIGPENIKRLPSRRVAHEQDVLKIASWGSARDMALIDRLRHSDGFTTLGALVDRWHWPHGRGVAWGGGHDPGDALPMRYLPSGKMPRFSVRLDTLGTRPSDGRSKSGHKDPRIYQSPILIGLRGLKRHGFHAAVSEDDVLYTEEYLGFSTRGEHSEQRFFLNGILNSSITNYFLFLTGSVWGVERDKVELIDLLKLPVPDPNAVEPQLVEQVVRVERQLASNASSHTPLPSLLRDLDRAVFDLYGMGETERVLVEDTLNLTVDLRMRPSQSTALGRTAPRELQPYAASFIGVIQPFLQTLNERVIVADIFDVGASPLQIVRFSMAPSPARKRPIQTIVDQHLEPLLESISAQLPHRVANRVYTSRVLRIYVGNDLYIIKPAQRRYWSRSAGINDADVVLAEHLGAIHESAG